MADHETADLDCPSVSTLRHKRAEDSKLTRMSVEPVAQGGIEARIGAKKRLTRKQNPVETAVSPVRPPSAIPAPLSMKAVTGEQPNNEPIEMHAASVQ